VGDAVRLILPRPHELRAVTGGVGDGLGGRFAGPHARRHARVRALQRMGAGCLDRVEEAGTDGQAESPGLGQASPDGGGQGASAYLNEDPVEAGARRRERRGHLPAEGRAALDGRAVEVSLAGERHGAAGHRFEKAEVRRIAADPGPALADLEARPQLLQPGHDGGVGTGRDEHLERAPGGTSHDRRGQGRVAAAGNGEGRGGGRASAGAARGLGHLQLQQRSHQVACLVRARDVPGLVLDPDPAAAREAEPVAQLRGAEERRDPEAAPVHGSHALVQALDEGEVVGVAPAETARRVPGVEEGPVAQERVGLVTARELERGRVEPAGEDVVGVVAVGGGGAAQERRPAVRDTVAAARALEPGDRAPGPFEHCLGRGARVHEAARARALNSPIRSSHAAGRPRRSAQNSGRRRSWNASIEIPCCSTQV
jgi:hypothetical protein